MYLYIIFVTLAVYWLFTQMKKPYKFPPGPPRLPVVGSWPFIQVKGSFIHSMKFVIEKYGPVAGIYIGQKRMVIISDYNIIKGERPVLLSISFGQEIILTLDYLNFN